MNQDSLESFSRSYLRLAQNSPCILVTLKVNKKTLGSRLMLESYLIYLIFLISEYNYYFLHLVSTLSLKSAISSQVCTSLDQYELMIGYFPKGWPIWDFQMIYDNSILSTLLSPSISPRKNFNFKYCL